MDLVVSGILNFLTEQEAIGKADEVQDFYRYGIEITISSMLNIVLVLLMGALTGHLLESVIYLAVFIAVRVYYRRVSCRYIFQMQSADVFNIYCYSFS